MCFWSYYRIMIMFDEFPAPLLRTLPMICTIHSDATSAHTHKWQPKSWGCASKIASTDYKKAIGKMYKIEGIDYDAISINPHRKCGNAYEYDHLATLGEKVMQTKQDFDADRHYITRHYYKLLGTFLSFTVITAVN